MRVVGALIFAILATAALLGVPYWTTNAAPDVRSLVRGDELPLAERFVRDMRSRNYNDALAILEPAHRPADTAVFRTITALFPARHEDGTRVTAWHKLSLSGSETTQIEVFYEFGKDGAVRGIFTIFRDASGLKVRGARLESFTVAQLHANDFRLPATALDIRWAFLAVAAVFDVLAFATFVLCLISPVVRWRWRWLWLLVVLCGCVHFRLDWSTLQFDYQLVNVMAPPAQFGQVIAYGSWVLSLAAPFGALIYWSKRAQWRSEEAGAADIRTA
ncbi:MAG TPA: hypothetical protein VNU97_00545 [Rhizomicrobium sp.]|jgi:hypothetical protein|nr:hypothetical protein [Rhizomicrobium sp.]